MNYKELIGKMNRRAERVEAEKKLEFILGKEGKKLKIEKARKQRTEWEHELQVRCVQWFRLNHKEYGNLLFAIPNGGYRTKRTANMMRAEGVTAGVADLMLAVPSGDKHAMFIEMKTERSGSKQSKIQKEWQVLVEAQGYVYRIAKNFSEFKQIIGEYLGVRLEEDRQNANG